jgi:beta-lactamase regulating signal transducer with metallopeptidase domain/uncharacterized GH25 family protein
MNAHPQLEGQLNWLLNHSLQAGALVLLVLAVQWLFRRRLAGRWRFALWWIVLARLLLPFNPQSVVSLFNIIQPAVKLEGPRYAAPVPPAMPARNNAVQLSRPAVLPVPNHLSPAENPPAILPGTEAANLPRAVSVAPVSAIPKHSLSFDDFLIPGLAGLWLAGVLILSGVVVAQLLRFYRHLARVTTPVDSNLQTRLDDCRREFGLARRVELWETDAVASPALFGLLRLRLLVPRGFGGQFTGRELRYIFLHELAHVKRGDLWLNWLVTALQIIHWFNPLLWLGFARLRADRELACDELALLRAGDSAGTAYGETVVKLLENLSRPEAIPGLVGILEDKKQMRRRISMIANFRRPGKWSALAVILIAGIAAAALTNAQTEKSASAIASRPDLTGAVTAKGGSTLPVPANVFIATAAPKTGTSTFCPSCYADCVKHSRTDAQGNFKIESLDPQLTFQILAVAKGYQPKSVSKVDPAKGPVKVELEPIQAADASPDRSLRGRVLDVKGNPIAGAVVEMVGTETRDGGGSWGALPGIDPLAVTDDNGEFLITSKKPFELMDLKISARTFADKNFSKLPSGKENELVMTEGATIKGRVLLDGHPLQGVSVGISGVERRAGVYLGHFEVSTDGDGRFSFVNIPPTADFWIYTGMSSMKKSGAVPIQNIHSAKDGETTDVGDLVAVPAHRLAGRVVLADGAPLPPKVRLLVSRQEAWDSMQITLDTDGNFDTTGIPSELISLSAGVKDYHVSARNLSVDQLDPFQLIGRVDHDITNLVFALQKGPEPQPDYNHIDPEYNEIRLRPLQGAEGVVEHSRDWTISGRVIDADTKQPVENFRVTPGQTDQFNRAAWNTLRAVDGSNGVYLVYVSKRAWQPILKVEADGYLPAGKEIQPGDAANVDVLLKKGNGPAGTVVTPEGKPVAGATVILMNDEMNQAGINGTGELTTYGNRSAATASDTNGKFSLKPIFRMQALAVGSSNGLAIVSLESLATNRAITLPPFGNIFGILKRTSGPGSNETLDVTFAGEHFAGFNMWLPADTDEQGHFRFNHVPAGHLQISYRVPMGGNGWQDRPLTEADLKPGQTLEVNISAADRPAENERNSYQPPPLTPVPGEHLKGIVLAPDGKPAANAEVALQLTEGPFNLSLGRGFLLSSGLREKGLHVNADADGRFDLPLYVKALAVVAVNEEGFAQVPLDDFKKLPQIQLQKFGRIEGTLRVGHHAGTNETVGLSPAVPRNRFAGSTNPVPKFLQPLMYDSQAFSARADENGKFAIGFVPPGERSLWRRIPYGERGWTQSQLATCEVKPGETVVTNIGGNGRTVTGKVQFSGDFPVDFKNGMGIITTPTFKIYEKSWHLKTAAERKAFLASPEAEALRVEERSFSVRVATDGSFRTEDVLPGHYEFVFQPSVKLDEKSRTWTQLASAQEFTVPSAKDENDDSTVELGTFELKKRELLMPATDTEKK